MLLVSQLNLSKVFGGMSTGKSLFEKKLKFKVSELQNVSNSLLNRKWGKHIEGIVQEQISLETIIWSYFFAKQRYVF